MAAIAVVSCHGARVIDPTPPAWLDAKADERGRAAAPQAEPFGQPLRGVATRDDESASWEVQLDAQHCYVFSGLAEPTVERLLLYLFDQKNHKVTSEKSSTSASLLNYCPKEPGIYRLEGKIGHGYGHISVVTFQAAVAPVTAAPVVDLDAVIDQQAASAAPGARRVGEAFVGKADQTDWYAAMNPGSCYWIIGAGEPDRIKRLSIYLWDPQAHRITESKAETNVAMVGHCPTSDGMFKFQVKLQSGSGTYKAAVFQRPR